VSARPDGLEIGPYRPGEESALLACLGNAFGFEPELARWRHLYLENPAGEPILVLARDRATVVGHVGILPARIRAFREEAMAGHQIDGGVDPGWRRRGVRTALAAEARRLACARGSVATYGVSNEQSTHTVLKHEARTSLGPLPVMVRPLRPIAAGVALVRRALTGPSARDVDCAVAGPRTDDGRLAAVARTHGWTPAAFDERHTRLFRDADGLPPVAIVRDAAYLTWRYVADTPTPYWQQDVVTPDGLDATAVVRSAELAGLCIIFVMEWHWRHGAAPAARRLIQDVVSLGRAVGAHAVTAMATHGTPHRRALARRGFLPVPQWLFPRTSVMSVRPDREGAGARPWTDIRSWYLTWGDGLVL